MTHTSCPGGKRVRVVLHNRDKFFDKFLGASERRVLFKGRGYVWKRDIKSMTIVR